MHEYLTARELADLLRIKERKLYELVSDGAIPVTRVTGKLLFPRDAVREWMDHHTRRGEASGTPADSPRRRPPLIVAGSHDPLLEWALRASAAGLATWMDGSADGLARMKTGEAMAAGIHFHSDDADPNAARVSAELQDEPVVLIAWALRSQGLVLSPGVEARALGDLAGRRIVRRQPGSGSHALFERLAEDSGLGDSFADTGEPARTESEVAQAVANGRADAGIAIEAAARQFGLGFLPLAIERFDILVWRRDYFEPPFQKLLALTRTPQFVARAAEFAGYDVSDTGAVRYNGP